MPIKTEKQTPVQNQRGLNIALNVEDIAKLIIDDVLKIQVAEQWQGVNLAIVRIQRAARQLLITHYQKPSWVDGLVEYVDAVEQGVEIRGKDLEQHLMVLGVAAAKIRNRLVLAAAVNQAEQCLGSAPFEQGLNRGQRPFDIDGELPTPPRQAGAKLIPAPIRERGVLEVNDHREAVNG